MPTKDWDVEAELTRIKSKLYSIEKVVPAPCVYESDITYERLKNCYVTVAKIVATHGDVYLPIFERLHTELEEFKNKQDMLERAFQVAKF